MTTASARSAGPPTPSDSASRGVAEAPEGAALRFEIRPDRGRPLHFSGRLVARASTPARAGLPGHAATLYAAARGAWIVALRIEQNAGSDPTIRAWRVKSREAALETLCAHDAGEDVPVAVNADDPSLSPAETAAAALDLMARISLARRTFARLVDVLRDRSEPGP